MTGREKKWVNRETKEATFRFRYTPDGYPSINLSICNLDRYTIKNILNTGPYILSWKFPKNLGLTNISEVRSERILSLGYKITTLYKQEENDGLIHECDIFIINPFETHITYYNQSAEIDISTGHIENGDSFSSTKDKELQNLKTACTQRFSVIAEMIQEHGTLEEIGRETPFR